MHTIGNTHNGKDLVGGPASMKGDHACDGKSIDHLGACAGG